MPGFPSFRTCSLCGAWAITALGASSCGGLAASGAASPQWAPDSASVRVAAGPAYHRSAVWNCFFGEHYRRWWTTPVTVPVLRISAGVPGGLVPLQTGGSYQTHTLRLRATATGTEYVLRSVDKDMSAALRPGLLKTLLRGLVKDQTSATHPYGAYPAAQLAEALGVLHANPRLVYVGNDPGLGKFRAQYANALYLFEERPDGDQRAVPSFGNSPNVVNTAHMLAHLRKRPSAHVPARAYLRARLLDMLLGDWSRRPDQWRWATFPQPGRLAYRPIPRDRDQAFFLFDDGLITRLVAGCAPKYCSFHAAIGLGNVDGLTRTARSLDRTLLTSLSAAGFREVADSVRRQLSDAVIAQALMVGPLETRPEVTAQLGFMLRARREQLPAVAQRYFEILNKEAWLVGTDQAERFVLSSAGTGRVRVQLLTSRAPQPDSLLTDRVFDAQTTPQLNLYGLAGDDTFEVRGKLPEGIAVGLYPGTGYNEVLAAARPAAGDITWYADAKRRFPVPPAGIRVTADPHPEQTANSGSWLKQRYNLRD
jgi:hypothetical protein